jgi:hypothetical protein
MAKAGIDADILPVFKRKEYFALWLLSRKSRPYRIVYNMGGCAAIFFIIARLRGKRTINHWLGTDAMRYHGRLTVLKRIGIWVHQHLVDLELADSETIQKELKDVGIKTNLLRLLPKAVDADVKALPRKPAVLSYWFDDRFDFYGGPVVFALARAMPDVEFLIAQAEGKGLADVPGNVQFLGPVKNMSELYRRCTCLVRMPQHDGLSAMVLEAFANGRYVIYNQQYPFVHFADDFNSAFGALREILSKDGPNVSGADYIRKNFNIDAQAECLRQLMENSFGNI